MLTRVVASASFGRHAGGNKKPVGRHSAENRLLTALNGISSNGAISSLSPATISRQFAMIRIGSEHVIPGAKEKQMKQFAMIVAISGLFVSSSASLASSLSDSDIRAHIAGRRIHLAVPFGGEFPLNYRRSGVVDGNGEALGLGRFVKPSDSGRWWIQGARLCQQFKNWYNGTVLCFRLTWVGERKLQWVQDNGDVGTARVGERID